MSNKSENKLSTCANCGKGEEASINLKSCAACMLVKYCSRDCQSAHRPQHKRECKERAKEIHEEKLFEQPPPLEDCPICMIRLPTLDTGRTYMNCCGKVICTGCIHAVKSRARREEDDVCPFCRTPPPRSDEEIIKRIEKRMELNDAQAISCLGDYYATRQYGLPQSYTKALELWHRSAELGHAEAFFDIAHAYTNGNGVERDEKKAKHFYEQAAMGRHVVARFYLGAAEMQKGKMGRALKHYMIAVKDGMDQCLENIKKLYRVGCATKDDYTEALRSYQAYLDEIKSDQRDKAAAYSDEKIYYSAF